MKQADIDFVRWVARQIMFVGHANKAQGLIEVADKMDAALTEIVHLDNRAKAIRNIPFLGKVNGGNNKESP